MRLLLLAAAAAFASIAPQAHGQSTKAQHRHSNTVSTVSTDKRATNAANDDPKGCPGTQYPQLRCEAIAAQAELEQARQSARQADQTVRQADQSTRQGNLFTAEVWISGLTMIAAIAAAIFAARASTASWRMLKLERARHASDLWTIVHFDVEAQAAHRLQIIVKNNSGAEAKGVKVEDVRISTSSGINELPLALAEVAGPERMPPNGNRQFWFSNPGFVFGLEDMRASVFDSLQVTVWATLKFIDWAEDQQIVPKRFEAKVNPIKEGALFSTVRLQATDMTQVD